MPNSSLLTREQIIKFYYEIERIRRNYPELSEFSNNKNKLKYTFFISDTKFEILFENNFNLIKFKEFSHSFNEPSNKWKVLKVGKANVDSLNEIKDLIISITENRYSHNLDISDTMKFIALLRSKDAKKFLNESTLKSEKEKYYKFKINEQGMQPFEILLDESNNILIKSNNEATKSEIATFTKLIERENEYITDDPPLSITDEIANLSKTSNKYRFATEHEISNYLKIYQKTIDERRQAFNALCKMVENRDSSLVRSNEENGWIMFSYKFLNESNQEEKVSLYINPAQKKLGIWIDNSYQNLMMQSTNILSKIKELKQQRFEVLKKTILDYSQFQANKKESSIEFSMNCRNKLILVKLEEETQNTFFYDNKKQEWHPISLDKIIELCDETMATNIKGEKYEIIKEYVIKGKSNDNVKTAETDTEFTNFKIGVDNNLNNPKPKTPYRGIGLEVEKTEKGLKIMQNFSDIDRFKSYNDANDSWLSHKIEPTADKELYITHMLVESEDGKLLNSIKITQDTDSKIIAQHFHKAGIVRFIVNDGINNIDYRCDTRINASAIFIPNSSNSSNEISNFAALSTILKDNKVKGENAIEIAIENANKKVEETSNVLAKPIYCSIIPNSQIQA